MTSTARRLAVPATLIVAAVTLSGCFGHGDTRSQGPPQSGSASPVAVAPLKVRSGVTRVVGQLAPDARTRLAGRAGSLVKAYFQAAFLDPRAGQAAGPLAFPGFTPGARALAERDHDVLTGAPYAGADRVSPRGGTAYFNVLAPNGHPVGATVRVGLTLSVTDGGRTRPVAVSGRLMLTPTAHGWRIFGYDLSQSGRHARSAG
jgi:hypothetical protein